MKIYRYIGYLFFAFAASIMSACTDEDMLGQSGDSVNITFRPSLGGELNTRAIGDATGIDQLVVAVYEGNGTLSKTFSYSEDWNTVQQDGITLSLIEGRTYNIIFWAQDADNKAYSLTDDGKISVNYEEYLNDGFSQMEQLDAFYATETVTVGAQKVEDKGTIYLTRPLAQVNFADNTTKPVQETHKAVVTFHRFPTSFDPFSGMITMSESDMSFIFKDFPEEETLNINNSSYYYVASNYLFAPAEGTTSIEATLDLQQIDGTSINTFEFSGEKAITLEKNKKTNVLGAIVLQPETWSVWNGEIPTESTLTTDPENQNRYIIDEANDVAWLSVKENAQSLAANSTFVMTVDVDMNNGSGLTAIQLPSGSTLDGDGHTIKGLQLENALLGDVTDITVKNLTIEETTVANTSADVTHVGVLVNTLKGSNTFSNIHIKSSSVSTQNGAAGGIVGYISRKSPNDRNETLTVIFDNCHVTETTVNGTQSEGHFVGLLRGYDNKETLQFNSNCTLTLSATVRSVDDFVSPYREGNEGTWLANNDYSKYDGWLGDEECYRGTVIYGDNRFIPCWDGETKVTPLTEGSTKLIYSAFDLASLQGSGHTSVTFKEDVDLGGNRATNKNPFTPISAIGTLDGENHKLYNLNIFYNSWIVGFINGTSGTETVHKNLHFVNSSVRADMTGNEKQVYVGTLCPYVQHKYIVDNITINDGYVLGLGKLGGLIGFVTSETTASLDCSKCSVISSTIENIESSAVDRFGNSYVYADFNPQGEVGGLIGFIGNDVVITDCHVTNCNINCYGQDKKTAAGIFAVPGRHVNRFIGDIRTINGDIIKILGCTAENNSFGIRDEDTQYNQFNLVGRCYYIEIGINMPFIGKVGVFDTKGKLFVDEIEYAPSKNNGDLKK